jgi:hypothetical protein
MEDRQEPQRTWHSAGSGLRSRLALVSAALMSLRGDGWLVAEEPRMPHLSPQTLTEAEQARLRRAAAISSLFPIYTLL